MDKDKGHAPGYLSRDTATNIAMAAPATGGATPAPVKVLVVGQINGRLDLLAPRVAAVHAQHGPFDVVLAVGGLFSVNPADNQPIEAFIAGEKKCTCDRAAAVPCLTRVAGADLAAPYFCVVSVVVPLDMLFINGPTPIPRAAMDIIERNGGQLCENITFLGHRGVLTTTSGLKVGYLSGVYDSNKTDPTDPVENPSATRYTRADIDALVRNTRKDASYAGLDILVTYDWPRGVTRLAAVPEGANVARSGTDAVADLARELRPRYHFAGQEGGVYYERAPYRNLPVVPGKAMHVTRFFGTPRPAPRPASHGVPHRCGTAWGGLFRCTTPRPSHRHGGGGQRQEGQVDLRDEHRADGVGRARGRVRAAAQHHAQPV